MRLRDVLRAEGRGAVTKLAEQTGKTWQTIHLIAKGEQVPTIETALLIVDAPIVKGRLRMADLIPRARKAG